jgi:hypothetical protein
VQQAAFQIAQTAERDLSDAIVAAYRNLSSDPKLSLAVHRGDGSSWHRQSLSVDDDSAPARLGLRRGWKFASVL